MPNPNATPSWTSMRLANRAARVSGLGPDAKTRFHLVFRNMVMKGAVPTVVDEDDARHPLLFDDRAAAAILLVSPLADTMGVGIDRLREIASKLISIPALGGGIPADRALDAARSGRKADLVIRVVRRGAEPPRLDVRVCVEGEEPAAEAASIISNYNAVSLEVLSTTTIDVNQRLRPLIAESGD